MKKVVIAIVAVLIACGAVFIATRHHYKNRQETQIVEKEILVEKETEISSDIIKSGLNDIGELATEEYYYTGVETYDSSKSIKGFDIPLTKTKFVYSYDGTIKAGIDFAKIDVEKDDLTKVITVFLPESRILSSEIDENSFQLYDEKTSIFNPFSVSDVNDTIIELKASAEKKAIEKGLLDRADDNAKTLMKNFLKSTYGLDGYTIKTVVK